MIIAKIPMVIPSSERNVRNLFANSELVANEILSLIKPKTIIQILNLNFTNVPKKFPPIFQIFESKKSSEIGFINKKNIYQQSSYKTLEGIKINTFVTEI